MEENEDPSNSNLPFKKLKSDNEDNITNDDDVNMESNGNDNLSSMLDNLIQESQIQNCNEVSSHNPPLNIPESKNNNKQITSDSGRIIFNKIDYPTSYGINHNGPFIVIAELINNDNTSGEKMKFLSPIFVSSIIIPIYKDNINSITSAGRYKVKVIFNSKRDANSIILNNKLSEENNLKFYIPKSAVTKQLIVKAIPENFNDS